MAEMMVVVVMMRMVMMMMVMVMIMVILTMTGWMDGNEFDCTAFVQKFSVDI